MIKVTFHEEANLEVIEAVQYYQSRAFGLGNAFIAEVEEAVQQILINPKACQLIGDEVRRKLIKRFPFSLIYAIEGDCIKILAVAHQKRRPGYWSYRS